MKPKLRMLVTGKDQCVGAVQVHAATVTMDARKPSYQCFLSADGNDYKVFKTPTEKKIVGLGRKVWGWMSSSSTNGTYRVYSWPTTPGLTSDATYTTVVTGGRFHPVGTMSLAQAHSPVMWTVDGAAGPTWNYIQQWNNPATRHSALASMSQAVLHGTQMLVYINPPTGSFSLRSYSPKTNVSSVVHSPSVSVGSGTHVVARSKDGLKFVLRVKTSNTTGACYEFVRTTLASTTWTQTAINEGVEYSYATSYGTAAFTETRSATFAPYTQTISEHADPYDNGAHVRTFLYYKADGSRGKVTSTYTAAGHGTRAASYSHTGGSAYNGSAFTSTTNGGAFRIHIDGVEVLNEVFSDSVATTMTTVASVSTYSTVVAVSGYSDKWSDRPAMADVLVMSPTKFIVVVALNVPVTPSYTVATNTTTIAYTQTLRLLVFIDGALAQTIDVPAQSYSTLPMGGTSQGFTLGSAGSVNSIATSNPYTASTDGGTAVFNGRVVLDGEQVVLHSANTSTSYWLKWSADHYEICRLPGAATQKVFFASR